MNATVKHWISRHGDIGSYRTTVTLYGDTFTTAYTLPGKFSRKQALERVYQQMIREGGQWSPWTLQAVKALL